MSNPSEDLMAVFAREKEKIGQDNPILVPESYYDTAVRIAEENNITVKIEPVKAAWKTDENMKPIEKYQQKFIELLKEAEEELGGNLAVRVTSTEKGLESNTCLGYVKSREYKCSISTANDFLL